MSRTVPTATPHRGEKKLVISIDFGTTFSGTSWVLLENGQVPHIWDVTSFEGQEHLQVPKVPTVLYYDKNGQMRAAGAQTLDRSIQDSAKREKWTRVEWFKLLLSPKHLDKELKRAPITRIPDNKQPVDLIADFLRYMGNAAHRHFHESMDAGGTIWEEVKNQVTYILSHPNGWNTSAHSVMREAAIKAGLVLNTDQEQDNIIFVSEGEASLHWCMNRGVGRGDLKEDSHFIVVDAGGGTIDISSFKTMNATPPEFEESHIPACFLQGSAFVTKAFRDYITDKLNNSSSGDPSKTIKTISRLVRKFDQKEKCKFRGRDEDVRLKIGEEYVNGSGLNIKDGKLLVSGGLVASFFEPACHAIDTSVKAIVGEGKATVVLVGGFAGNSYLFKEVKERLSTTNIQVLRSNDATAKASANGVICFYLDRSVKARMAKWSYGIQCVHNFDPNDPKHLARRSHVKSNSVTGQQLIEGGFFVTLKKGTVVRETELTRFPFWHGQPTPTAATLELVLECYRGDVSNITFRDEDHEDQFQKLCWFQANIPGSSYERRKSNFFGKRYYVSNFFVVVSFGATEFKCFIEWKEKGETRRGPITPIWS